jgi:carboxylate-amine ligase
MRDGVEGTLADPDTGERVPTRELLRARLQSLHPTTEALIVANGAIRTRSIGVDGAAEFLADQFLA